MANKNKGFSLIEILVVVGIIGIIGALSVWGVRSAQKGERDAKRVSDVRQIQAALEMHFNDENVYPSSVLEKDSISGVNSGIVYMFSVPGDPLGPNGYGYRYVSESPYDTYDITFQLEKGIGGLAAGIHALTPEGMR